ncbi:MAG TPA: alanine--glyoxylate aminotransferase family protein [Bryobacteraceae bacterium]|nr:alanine--glyoxylate aminotransferase family protein [Bryobacteraceae bacterium]
MHIKKQRLLTAGPTPLYPKALQAMLGADLHHRTRDFRDVVLSVLAGLKALLGTANDVLILTASGTGAMEAAVTNCFSPGDRVIVCSAGKFGERWVEIAKAYGLDVVLLSAPYGRSVEAEAVEKALGENPDVKGVFVQASESSTGAAHDVQAMGHAIERAAPQALFVVDAITGLGTMPLDIDGWGLDLVVGGSQKAFMIPPGLAFLSVSPKAWARMETAALPRYYFDLRREKKNALKGESSWTPATSLMLGLAEVLKYLQTFGPGKQGFDKLVENARHLAAATRAACVTLGLELFAPDRPSSAVTAVVAPPGLDSSVIVKEFRERFGSIVNDGQAEMKGRIFRIAHLGYFDVVDLFGIVAQLEVILDANGFPVKLGSGVATVQKYYAEHAPVPDKVTSKKQPVTA